MSTYTGPSVVDYLTSVGQASDYNSRTALATKYGISGYAGTADQNTQLLNMLRSGASAPQSTTPTPAPAGGGATSPVPQPTGGQTNTSSYTPPAAVSANDLRTQLTNDQIDANAAKQQLTQRLAQSYGGTLVNGNPQFTNPQAQQAYQAALPAALAGLFAGLGDVKQGGQFGEFDTNGNFSKKSTTVNAQIFSTGGASTNNNNVAVLKGQPNIDATHQYGSPATGYYATYAEAVNAANNINNGINLGANAPAGPTTTAPTGAPAPVTPGAPAPVPGAPATGATPTAPQVDANGNPIPPAPLAPPANPAGPGGGAQSTYAGPSVVDYLNSIGQSSDFSSRAKIASNLGIQNYTGSASQNTQMLNSLRSAGGGKSTSTTSAGAASGAAGGAGGAGGNGDGTNISSDTQSILSNATAIAKAFGWTAPDPNNSPLNIATNLFQQGLQQYGLTDLKTQINSVLQQQTDLQNAQADEVAAVNSNPWLTEGERVNRINKIGDKYSTKLDILTHQQQLYEADYKTGLDQVQWQVGQAMSAYNTAQSENDKIFQEGLSLAEKQVDAQNALAAAKATAAGKTTVLSPGAQLVDANGKVIAQAPRAPTAGTKPTVQEQKDTAYNQINQLLTMKDSAGTPYLDGNGYLNPDLFKGLITAAAADGIGRADFLDQYGSYIYQGNASSYGLTPAEQKKLGFTQ